MGFKLKPYKDLLAMTKEKIEEAMLPLRVRSAKARADGEVIKLEEKMITLEAKINEACAKKDIDFNAITDMLDDYDLTERRLKQINELVTALFPEAG